MFTAACDRFVKTIGETTLHATPSYDQKDNVKLFQVVLKSKRRRFIFCEKSVFRPSKFQLTDILVEKHPLNIKPTTHDIVDKFNHTTKTSLKAKIGAIMPKNILDVGLDAKDTLTLDIVFGSVKKQDVREQDLIDELSNRRIDMGHQYVKDIRADKRNSLCLISGLAFLPDGGSIHRVSGKEANASGGVPVKFVNVKAGAGVEHMKDCAMDILKNTAVAYNMHELEIDTNTGAIKLVLTEDKNGGFRVSMGDAEADELETATVDFQPDHAREMYSHFLRLDPETRSQVNKNLLKLMEYPRDVVLIADLLNNVEAEQEVKTSFGEIAKQFVSPREVLQYVLEQAGFSVIDDRLVTPEAKEKVTMLGEFFDAATVLEESLLEIVTSLSALHADNFLTVLRSCMQRAPVTDKKIVAGVLGDEISNKLLEHLKYRLNESGVIETPAEVPFCIDALYCVVFALYGA